jgi:hypothetical protein
MMKTNIINSTIVSLIEVLIFTFGVYDLSETILRIRLRRKVGIYGEDAAARLLGYSSLRLYIGVKVFPISRTNRPTSVYPLSHRYSLGRPLCFAHKHQLHSQIGHFWTEWNYSYAGINACNKLLADKAVQASEAATATESIAPCTIYSV